MGFLQAWTASALLVIACFSTPTLAGCCGNMGTEIKEGVEKSLAVREDIKKELGVDANVNFDISNGSKTIHVELQTTPEGGAAEIKAKVETIVRKHFPDADTVDVKI